MQTAPVCLTLLEGHAVGHRHPAAPVDALAGRPGDRYRGVLFPARRRAARHDRPLQLIVSIPVPRHHGDGTDQTPRVWEAILGIRTVTMTGVARAPARSLPMKPRLAPPTGLAGMRLQTKLALFGAALVLAAVGATGAAGLWLIDRQAERGARERLAAAADFAVAEYENLLEGARITAEVLAARL